MATAKTITNMQHFSRTLPISSQIFETGDGVQFSTGSAHLFRSVTVAQRKTITETQKENELEQDGGISGDSLVSVHSTVEDGAEAEAEIEETEIEETEMRERRMRREESRSTGHPSPKQVRRSQRGSTRSLAKVQELEHSLSELVELARFRQRRMEHTEIENNLRQSMHDGEVIETKKIRTVQSKKNLVRTKDAGQTIDEALSSSILMKLPQSELSVETVSLPPVSIIFQEEEVDIGSKSALVGPVLSPPTPESEHLEHKLTLRRDRFRILRVTQVVEKPVPMRMPEPEPEPEPPLPVQSPVEPVVRTETWTVTVPWPQQHEDVTVEAGETMTPPVEDPPFQRVESQTSTVRRLVKDDRLEKAQARISELEGLLNMYQQADLKRSSKKLIDRWVDTSDMNVGRFSRPIQTDPFQYVAPKPPMAPKSVQCALVNEQLYTRGVDTVDLAKLKPYPRAAVQVSVIADKDTVMTQTDSVPPPVVPRRDAYTLTDKYSEESGEYNFQRTTMFETASEPPKVDLRPPMADGHSQTPLFLLTPFATGEIPIPQEEEEDDEDEEGLTDEERQRRINARLAIKRYKYFFTASITDESRQEVTTNLAELCARAGEGLGLNRMTPKQLAVTLHTLLRKDLSTCESQTELDIANVGTLTDDNLKSYVNTACGEEDKFANSTGVQCRPSTWSRSTQANVEGQTEGGEEIFSPGFLSPRASSPYQTQAEGSFMAMSKASFGSGSSGMESERNSSRVIEASSGSGSLGMESERSSSRVIETSSGSGSFGMDSETSSSRIIEASSRSFSPTHYSDYSSSSLGGESEISYTIRSSTTATGLGFGSSFGSSFGSGFGSSFSRTRSGRRFKH